MAALDQFYDSFRKRIAEKFHLTGAETDVLLFLSNNPQFQTAAHIAKLRKMPKSHVSLAVSRLIQRGYLSARPDPEHRRRILLQITANAEDAVAFGRKQQQAFWAQLCKGLTSEDLDTIQRIFEKVKKNLGSSQEDLS